MRLVDTYYPGCKIAGVGVWSVAPGQKHPMHVDDQPLEWIVRVHIPLTTNPDAIFIMRDGKYHMKVGKAYEFNTLAEHAVENLGVTMRDHFIIEVVNA